MRLGEIKGVTVTISPVLLTLLACAALLGKGREPMLSFFFVFCHELCHTLAALAMGVEVEEIELFPFGGVAKSKGIARAKGGKEALIALAGPLFNFACAAICYGVALFRPSAAQMLLMPLSLNVYVGLFNLIPAFPLDGGRILHSVLSLILPKERATGVCATLGVILGLGMTAIGLWGVQQMGKVNPLLLSVGIFVAICAGKEKRGNQLRFMGNLEEKRRTIHRGSMEERWITAGEANTVWEVANRAGKHRYLAVRVVDAGLRPVGVLYENDLLDAVLRGESQKTLGELMAHH